jgi:hypothetical protein
MHQMVYKYKHYYVPKIVIYIIKPVSLQQLHTFLRHIFIVILQNE